MKKRYIILFIPFIIFLYLKIDNILNPWKEIKVFEGHQTPRSIIFNDNIGFITTYGDHLWDTNLSYWKACNLTPLNMYKTTDYGDSWRKIALGQGDDIGFISFNSNKKILFVAIHQKISLQESTVQTLQSFDYGETWKPFDLNKSLIKNIHYYNPSIPLIGTDKAIYFLKNNKINRKVNINKFAKYRLDNKNNVWIANDEKISKVTSSGVISNWKVKELLYTRRIDWDKEKEKLYMIGRSKNDENKTLLISMDQKGKYSVIKRFSSLLVDTLVVRGDTIVIAGSHTGHFGLLGSRKLLYISKDGGKSWSQDRYYPTFARDPFFFDEKKSILWVYGAWGRFYKRKI